jgi:spore coat protein U-like protein
MRNIKCYKVPGQCLNKVTIYPDTRCFPNRTVTRRTNGMKALLIVFFIFSLLLMSVDANADRCDVTTTPVSFGSYDVFSSFPLDTTGTISVSCHTHEHKTIPIEVSISSGLSGGFNPRQMQQAVGAARMNYYLFLNSSRTQIWGDGSSGTFVFQGNIHKDTPLNLPVYGRIPARQNLRGGAFYDNLVVTVTW